MSETSERLIHYSERPLLELKPVEKFVRGDGLKPKGLWVSVGDDWKRWCEGEAFSQGHLACAHEVKLIPSANILRLNSDEDVIRFHEQYNVSLFPMSSHSKYSEIVDWARVTQNYQGIIIAPYSGHLHMYGPIWYNIWDCASGCIWDVSAVQEIRLLEPV